MSERSFSRHYVEGTWPDARAEHRAPQSRGGTAPAYRLTIAHQTNFATLRLRV
jgi:hypothetical protein